MRIAAAAFLIFLNTGCTFVDEHNVDTMVEWCEQIKGVDLEEKYGGAFIFSVSFDAEKIRDDITIFINDAYVEKTKGRANKMAWREKTTLHIVNLSGLFIIKPEKIINEYRENVQSYWNIDNDKEVSCFFGPIATMFDKVTIHSEEYDSIGRVVKDNTIDIDTLRKQNLGDKRL